MKELELVYGVHAVTAVLDGGGRVHALWLLDSRHDDRLAKIAALAEKAARAAEARPGITIARQKRLHPPSGVALGRLQCSQVW